MRLSFLLEANIRGICDGFVAHLLRKRSATMFPKFPCQSKVKMHNYQDGGCIEQREYFISSKRNL